jgi:hypothetical protein
MIAFPNRRTLQSTLIATLTVATLSTAHAQVNTNDAVNAAGQATGQIGNTAGQTLNNAAGQAPRLLDSTGRTVGQVGNTAGNLVGGLQPTLQPVTQGAGNALNNLTQPDTVAALLEFLSGVIPNHIEAHVNLDALRVEKLTVDVRGVDLRNLRVDLLVANSRNAGQARPALPSAGQTSGANNNLSSPNLGGVNAGGLGLQGTRPNTGVGTGGIGTGGFGGTALNNGVALPNSSTTQVGATNDTASPTTNR